jgi:hypothetical protein
VSYCRGAWRCWLPCQRRSRYTRRALLCSLYHSLYATCAAVLALRLSRCARGDTRRALRFWLCAFLAVREAHCGSGSDSAPCLTADAARCCLLYQRRYRYTRRALRFWLYAFLAVREARCGSDSDCAPCLTLQAPRAAVFCTSAVLAIRNERCGSGSTPFFRCTRGALRLRFRFCAVSYCRRRALLSSVPAPFSLYAACAAVLALHGAFAVREAHCGSDSDCAPCLTADARRCCVLFVPVPFSLYATCGAAPILAMTAAYGVPRHLTGRALLCLKCSGTCSFCSRAASFSFFSSSLALAVLGVAAAVQRQYWVCSGVLPTPASTTGLRAVSLRASSLVPLAVHCPSLHIRENSTRFW